MARRPSKGSGCHEDNLRECAELVLDVLQEGKCGDPQEGTHTVN